MHTNAYDNESFLWNQFSNGDEQAFVSVFRQYYGPLFNYGKKMTEDAELVEDCIQELFVDLWKTRGKASIQSLNAYLFSAFKFKLLRMIRRNGRLVLHSDAPEDAPFVLSPETLLIDKEGYEENMMKMRASIQSLSPRQQEIIYLRYYQCLDYEAISTIMQINYQAARNLCSQAVKTLKRSVLLLLAAFMLFR